MRKSILPRSIRRRWHFRWHRRPGTAVCLSKPKRSFIGHELHRWPNFDLLIVDGALADYDRTENIVIVGKVTLTGVVRDVAFL